MPYEIRSFWNENKRAIKALCFLVILSSILAVANSAIATSKRENIDELMREWENKYGKASYWKVENVETTDLADGAQSQSIRPLPSERSASQAALRNSVKKFISTYKAPPTNPDLFWPVFQSLQKITGGQSPPLPIGGRQ